MLILHGFVYLLAEGLVLPLHDPTLNRWAETTRCFEAPVIARLGLQQEHGVHLSMSISQATQDERPI